MLLAELFLGYYLLAVQILDDVAELKATLASTERKKAELEGQALKTTDQLKRAEQLIGGLGDERERWQESADRLAKDLKNLVGNVMLASGCLAYLGPFTRFVLSRQLFLVFSAHREKENATEQLLRKLSVSFLQQKFSITTP